MPCGGPKYELGRRGVAEEADLEGFTQLCEYGSWLLGALFNI